MDRKTQKKFTAILVLAITISYLSVGILNEPKIQASTPKNNELTNTSIAAYSENKTSYINNSTINNVVVTKQSGPETSSVTDSEQPEFQVTTDYGYNCTTGDPKQAIQDAIYSLPDHRAEPLNIYLEGEFNPIYDITLEDNINFIGVGTGAVLILDNHEDMFTFNQTSTYSETIDNGMYWIALSNITFQNLHFNRTATDNSESCAVFFYIGNSTGWGAANNLSIYNCEFDGFYNSVQGLAINSNYVGNFFHNYSNNAMMIPFGGNLTVTANTFDTPANPMTVEQYQERDGSISVQGGIGLFLMDVGWNNLISDNLFIQDTNSIGISFSSSLGNSFVTNNTFTGNGNPCSIDFFLRPVFSSEISFYCNNGTSDFWYADGVYN